VLGGASRATQKLHHLRIVEQGGEGVVIALGPERRRGAERLIEIVMTNSV
jgi:hypothetical protein